MRGFFFNLRFLTERTLSEERNVHATVEIHGRVKTPKASALGS